MEKLRLMTIVGTRPEIIRLSEVIRLAEKAFDHTLVHTGQNWDKNLGDVFFEELGLPRPKHTLGCVGETLGHTLGNILTQTYELMAREKPEALLILGDTNSALAAIPAKRLKIPIFHMEAGNRCFDENVPEEINRRIVDHISDINLPYTEHSRRYLLEEGIPGKRIFVTGSPMKEVLERNLVGIGDSPVLDRLSLEPEGYFVVSAHREENIDHEGRFFALMEALNQIARTYGIPLIYSTHPRTRKAITKRGFTFHPLVRNMEPLGFLDYCKLQKHARCVLSDSGTLSEESAILGFPAVLLRTSTERPEAMERGTVVLGQTGTREVEQAVALAMSLDVREELPGDYRDRDVSVKVVRLIQSYTPIINREVWRKEGI